MIAANNMYLNEASQTIYHMNSDYWIRKACIEREEYYLDIQCFNETISEQEKIIAEQGNTITEQENTIAEQENTIQQLRDEIESLTNR